MDYNANDIVSGHDSSLIAESVDDTSLISSYDESNTQLALTSDVNDSSQSDILSASNVNIYAPNVNKYYKGPERFVVSLSDNWGSPLSNQYVQISINGNTYDRYTDNMGRTSLALELNSGIYNVITYSNGKRAYSTVTIKETVIAQDFTKMYKNSTKYEGTFLDSYGQRLPSNYQVIMNINGVFYTRNTDSNGVARLNINLNPGTYILTATNPVTGEMYSTRITVRSTITQNHDLTKYYKSNSQYSLRLLGDTGNPVVVLL